MFNIFNRNDTKIAGSGFRPFRKTAEDIKLERIELDKKIYGVKTDGNGTEETDNKQLLEAKKELNREQRF